MKEGVKRGKKKGGKGRGCGENVEKGKEVGGPVTHTVSLDVNKPCISCPKSRDDNYR